MNRFRPLLRWLGQGFIGVVSSTWVVTPLIALPQGSLPSQRSEPFGMAQASTVAEAARLHQQAIELYQSGRYAWAIPLAERSLAIWEQVLGENHPDVAASLNNLAVLSWAQNDLTSALDFHKRSLSVEEATLTLNLIVGSEAYEQNFLTTFAGTTNGVISLHLQAMFDSPVAAQHLLLAQTTLVEVVPAAG